MLSSLHIRDFAIIDRLDIEFAEGLSVFTGETGAGKSIIIDALSVILGERADSGMVRHGAAQAEISAAFQLAAEHPALPFLRDAELDDADGCLLRRSISAEGRSRAFINGRPVPLQQLKALGDLLADIYGQNAHQSLMRGEAQRELLDSYANLQTETGLLKQYFRAWQAAQSQLDMLQQQQLDRDAQLELLHYQLTELDQLQAQNGELERLEQQHQRLAAAHHLQAAAEQSLQQLYEDEGALSARLGAISRRLHEQGRIDERLSTVAGLIDEALIQVDEAADNLRHYLGHLESDPQTLDQISERIHRMQALMRKHQCDFAGLIDKHAQLRQKMADLNTLGENIAQSQRLVSDNLLQYKTLALRIRQSRSAAAEKLSTSVSAEMQALGMPKGRFQAQLEQHPDDPRHYRAHGIDQISFLVSVNPGQPLRELAKVASGGELSRISLGLQVALAGQGEINTLVFDEVDVGVGGAVAEIVGRKLRQLAAHKQIFCVTHLAQVAAQGQQHLCVSKTQLGEHTHSAVHALTGQERVAEIARMLGGVEISAQTVAVAAEMLAG